MKKYKYSAVNKKGEKITNIIEANSEDEVATLLTDGGLSPISISETIDFTYLFQQPLTRQKAPQKEKVIFLRELATMVSAGLPLDDALEVATSQTQNASFKRILGEVTKEIRSGSSLSNALEKFPHAFSKIEVSLIRAGEVSGKMDVILERLATDVEKQSILRGKVFGALTYPAFVLILALGVVMLITVKLVPAMQALYNGFGSGALPLPTEILISISNVVTGYYILLIIIILLIVIAIRYYASLPAGKLAIDTYILKVPVLGSLLSQYQIVIFIKTYAMLIASGLPVITSMNLVGDALSNSLYSKAILESSKEVEKGTSFATALSHYDFIPSILWRSLGIGEETGKTEEILTKIGLYFEEEVNDKVNNLTRLLEPILLVVLGGIVGFIAVAIYLPIYSFSSVIH